MIRRTLARATALVSAGAFAAFPLLRPWGDKTGDPLAMAEAFASPAWVASHSLGMLAWVTLAATLALGAGPDRWSRAAAWGAGLGAAAILPYYGAETFGLNGLATTALAGGDLGTLVAAQEAIRSGSVQSTAFGAGLLLLAGAGVALAVDTWRSGGVRRWVGVPSALGLAAYLPQFFAADAVRQAHGVALGVALAGWALAHARGGADSETAVAVADRRADTPRTPATV